MAKLNYIEYMDNSKCFLYEGNEPEKEVLFNKELEHDKEFIEFLATCDIEQVKEQINWVLDNYKEDETRI